MKKLFFLLNPRAGMRRANRALPEIIRLFIDHGYRCETYVTGKGGEATEVLSQKKPGSYQMVVCAGGDGTLNETIAGMLAAGMRCPLGYIPCGTTNDYASSIGLSGDVLQAARDIMEGRAQSIDIGSFNGRNFVYTATCGAFAKASYSTPQAAKNLLGHVAYILEGVKDLSSIRPIRMRVTAGDLVLEDDFLFCSITNSTSVGGILKLDSQMVALNDGKFEVTLVRNPTTPAQLSSILVGLTTQSVPNDMIHFFSAASIHVECDTPVEWTLDGEREPETDSVLLRNLHSAVRIVIPRTAHAAPFAYGVEEAEL